MSQTRIHPITAHLDPPKATSDPIMSRGPLKRKEEPSTLGAIAAAAVAGLAAGYVMNLFQSLATSLFEQDGKPDKPTREQGAQKQKKQRNAQERGTGDQDLPATVIAAKKISQAVLGRRLPSSQEDISGQVMHYLMAIASAEVYCLALEKIEMPKLLRASAFGVLLWLLADEIAVPATGLSKKPAEYPAHVHLTSLAAHLVFAASVEELRSLLRSDVRMA